MTQTYSYDDHIRTTVSVLRQLADDAEQGKISVSKMEISKSKHHGFWNAQLVFESNLTGQSSDWEGKREAEHLSKQYGYSISQTGPNGPFWLQNKLGFSPIRGAFSSYEKIIEWLRREHD